MGMEPYKANTAGIETLVLIEKYLQAQYPNGEIPLNYLDLIKALRKQFEFSDKKMSDLLFQTIGACLTIGASFPGSKSTHIKTLEKKFIRFYQKGNKKATRQPGETGPGRNVSEITRAMEILLSKIPPPMPYTYKRPQFIEDLITHKACIKHVIKPVKENDSYIHPIKPGERSATIESAHTKLMKLAKKKLVK